MSEESNDTKFDDQKSISSASGTRRKFSLLAITDINFLNIAHEFIPVDHRPNRISKNIEKNFLYRIPSVSCDLSVISLIRKPKSITSKNLEAAVTVRRSHHVTAHSVDSGQNRVSKAVICTVEAWWRTRTYGNERFADS